MVKKEHWIERQTREQCHHIEKNKQLIEMKMMAILSSKQLSALDKRDLLEAFTLPVWFHHSNKQIFIFDKDAADLIGHTEGLPDLREILHRAPFNNFAVDLGNGKGFLFATGRIDNFSALRWDYLKKTSSIEDKILSDRPQYYDANDAKMGFDWIPLTKDENQCRAVNNVADMRSLMHEEQYIMHTTFVENIVAYLCCKNAEIECSYVPPQSAKQTNKKRRTASTIHNVGFRIGQELRAYERAQSEIRPHQGGTVRPHMRRAHWHHYWIGPKDGERKLILKWIHPIFVARKNGEINTATGRPVPMEATT